MVILRFKDIKQTEKQELQSKLQDLRTELMKSNFQRTTRSVSNPGKVKEIRRTIAKILTSLKLRAIEKQRENQREKNTSQTNGQSKQSGKVVSKQPLGGVKQR